MQFFIDHSGSFLYDFGDLVSYKEAIFLILVILVERLAVCLDEICIH